MSGDPAILGWRYTRARREADEQFFRLQIETGRVVPAETVPEGWVPCDGSVVDCPGLRKVIP